MLIKTMEQSINYITTLPDFIEMQRVSFCWFISQQFATFLTDLIRKNSDIYHQSSKN